MNLNRLTFFKSKPSEEKEKKKKTFLLYRLSAPQFPTEQKWQAKKHI